ncbi:MULTISPECIES: hypothetical protein [unclassified Clostridium]|uniref:hypothetical protein n=1 Tax=unclassified Clostridium TaxID=2614128 RepID=UPI0025B85558|nr:MULTISPECIES: hypothetical protein [unclassified Clostridium]
MNSIYEFTEDFMDFKKGVQRKKGEVALIEDGLVRDMKGNLIFHLTSYNAGKYGRIKMIKENGNMNKSDLKAGMVVELRNGEMYTVIEIDNKKLIFDNNIFFNLGFWGDDLTYKDSCDDDIVKVYKSKHDNWMPKNHKYITEEDLLWKRKPVNKHSLIEIMQRYNGEGTISIRTNDRAAFEKLDYVLAYMVNYEPSDNIPKLFLEEKWLLEDESILNVEETV